MSRTLSWGILGTGRIAGVFARGVKQSQTGTLVAVGSRSQTAADTFGETWHIPHRYSRYEDVLADQRVQAIYIAIPHSFHFVRCWYSEDNFRLLDRVNVLAKQREVLPLAIALAYVLCQPFPTFPLIGPLSLSETRTSLGALDIELTPQEVRCLNLDA